MFALTFAGKVVQIEATTFPVAPAMSWIDLTGITPTPQVGWLYSGGRFAEPPVPPGILPENTPLRQEDIERLFLSIPGFNQARIDQAKKDRGKPRP